MEEEKNKYISVAKAVIPSLLAIIIKLLFDYYGIDKPYIIIPVFALIYIAAGYEVIFGAIRNIIHGELFGEEFLMSVATVGAFAIGEYTEAVFVMSFYEIGELFGDAATERSRKSVAALVNLRPNTATVLRDGGQIEINPEDIMIGDTVVVKAGEKIPVDGEIISGGAAVDLSSLTGEGMPVDVTEGDTVLCGSICKNGILHINATKLYGDTAAARIIEMLENGESGKAKADRFITRFSKIYTPSVCAAAILVAIIPSLLTGEWSVWIYRALMILMVSCPCSIVVSVPLAFFCAVGGLSSKGILIKSGEVIEKLSVAKTFVFDKTGTLTDGSFTVTAIHPEEISDDMLLDIAAAVEYNSAHPIAESIVRAHGGHIDSARVSDCVEYPGLGLFAVIDGRRYSVGNGKLMKKFGVSAHECELSGTVVHVAEIRENYSPVYLGHIVIGDTVKSDAASAVDGIKQLCGKCVMLTGDNAKSAAAVAEKLGIKDYRSDLLPENKVDEVKKLKTNGITVFVGDGINDAPVVSEADVGVAMGAFGSDAVTECSDAVIADDTLMKIPAAVKHSRRTMRIIRENIFISITVKLLIIVLSALGISEMPLAVVGDVGMLIFAVLNSLRALRIGRG